ncbi:MAG TPA: hypothetical protein VJX23_01785 [Candidatus Binataceae bacterium]|nr:hypothetical protein [Candidatus Binataceae bacterium]
MIDDRNVRVARNNAEWCDAVCRAHGNAGEFLEGMWLNRRPVPRFYPNAGTIAEPNPRQLDLIDDLIAARLPPGWAVKDSFCTLDLASRGFRVLFAAEWIYLPASGLKNGIASGGEVARWEIVRSDRALADWEAAWSRAGGGDGSEDRIFVPSLLQSTDITVVAGYRDGRVVAGAIANRSDGVVGWSNFFAPDAEMFDCGAASLATIAEVFPGLPIVGYEHGDELRNALALGFESIGPLRIWLKT